MDLVAVDPRFRVLHDRLEPPGEDPPEEPAEHRTERMEAAVAMIIRATTPLEMLLIKRATYEGDPWSGHMALPGGRWEPNDAGLLETSIRETLEETGIDLGAVGTPLGRLPDVNPASPRLPILRIAPFVFGVPYDAGIVTPNHEVETAHWIPIDRLRDPETSTEVRIHFSGFSKTFPSYAVGDEHVWGLTHRILTAFLERYPAGDIGETEA